MDNTKSPRLLYKEKMAVSYTKNELKKAFDESGFSVCFNYDRGHVGAKHELFAAIWEVNPDVIITEADLCIIADESAVWRDQLLLIDKNGNKETAKTISKFMDESGIISFEYQITNEAGLKVCHGPSDVKKPTATERFTSDLQINADKLVLSIKSIR